MVLESEIYERLGLDHPVVFAAKQGANNARSEEDLVGIGRDTFRRVTAISRATMGYVVCARGPGAERWAAKTRHLMWRALRNIYRRDLVTTDETDADVFIDL